MKKIITCSLFALMFICIFSTTALAFSNSSEIADRESNENINIEPRLYQEDLVISYTQITHPSGSIFYIDFKYKTYRFRNGYTSTNSYGTIYTMPDGAKSRAVYVSYTFY